MNFNDFVSEEKSYSFKKMVEDLYYDQRYLVLGSVGDRVRVSAKFVGYKYERPRIENVYNDQKPEFKPLDHLYLNCSINEWLQITSGMPSGVEVVIEGYVSTYANNHGNFSEYKLTITPTRLIGYYLNNEVRYAPCPLWNY